MTCEHASSCDRASNQSSAFHKTRIGRRYALRMRLLIVCCIASSSHALDLSRRQYGKLTAAGAVTLAPLTPLLGLANAASINACPAGANNCWSTTSTDKNGISPWKPPPGTKRADAAAELKAVIDSYPQEGQDKVDLGGWSYATDELLSSGYARLEFKSGLGNMAKFFNGGKPFIDDLEVLVTDVVAVKSSSRVGDSDFNVNAKRLNWITARLREKGWTAEKISF